MSASKSLSRVATLLALLSLSTRSGAEPLEVDLGGPADEHSSLTAASDYQLERAFVSVLKAQQDNVFACYGVATDKHKPWLDLLELGSKLSGQVQVNADLKAAQTNVKAATSTLEAANVSVSKAQDALSVWEKRTEPDAIKPTIAAKGELTAALKAQASAKAAVNDANTALAAAQVALSKVGSTADPKPMRDKFAQDLATLQNAQRSPKDFRKAAEDPARRKACKAYQDAVNAALNVDQATGSDEDEAAARVTARINDTIGKTTGVSSAVTGSSSALEQPGAPERVVYTVMAALGADSKTTGNQLLMTLNLASIGASDSTKPVESVLLRNLFLRVALPLEKTQNQSQAAAATGGTTRPSVSRMSFVLGGSLLDESDPRLPTHDDCFDFARTYTPFALDEKEDEKRIDERQLYYGQCAQIAANRDRLAWRVGAGLATTTEDNRQKTRTEILAAAAVYAPNDTIFFNAIAQRLLEPYVVNTVGGGFSLYVDAGGDKPGTQWGRLSIDALGLAELRPRDDAAGVTHSTGWEARLALTGYGKVASGGVAQFSVGPRILGSGEVGLFSTFALSYDADSLVTTLLTPPTTK